MPWHSLEGCSITQTHYPWALQGYRPLMGYLLVRGLIRSVIVFNLTSVESVHYNRRVHLPVHFRCHVCLILRSFPLKESFTILSTLDGVPSHGSSVLTYFPSAYVQKAWCYPPPSTGYPTSSSHSSLHPLRLHPRRVLLPPGWIHLYLRRFCVLCVSRDGR